MYRMCSEDNRRQYTIPHVYSRIIHVHVSSINTHVLNYTVSWSSTGPLVPDSLQYQVIGLRKASGGDIKYKTMSKFLTNALLPQTKPINNNVKENEAAVLWTYFLLT